MQPKSYVVPQEWYQCLDAGANAIRRPYRLPNFRHIGMAQLSIYHLPSFHDCYNWTVYKTGEVEFTLQVVVWKQVADGRRIEEFMMGSSTSVSPDPTLEVSVSKIDSLWFLKALKDLAAIRIPLVVPRKLGLDGETFGISVEHQFEVEWWCDGPPEWAELSGWTQNCLKKLRG